MNKNVLIVLAGGFVVAILVALLVQASLSEKKKAAAEEKVQILVAAHDLKVGTEIKEKDVKWQEWPQAMLFTGAVQKQGDTAAHEAVTGRVKEHVAMGQPIHKRMMIDAAKGNMLSASLRDGYRAVGIKVPVETIAGGLIGPGDYVDVILTYSMTRTGNSTIARKFATETILENVRVLGTDTKSIAQDLTEEGKKKKSKSKLTVTLEATPDGAEKIALASKMGSVNLALRSLGDSEPLEGNKSVTDIGLSKVMTEMVGGKGGQVRIYNGTQLQQVQISGGMPEESEEGGLEAEGSGMVDSYSADEVDTGEVLDAVQQGISDGISNSFGGDDEVQ